MSFIKGLFLGYTILQAPEFLLAYWNIMKKKTRSWFTRDKLGKVSKAGRKVSFKSMAVKNMAIKGLEDKVEKIEEKLNKIEANQT